MRALYVSHNGMLENLGQAQVLPYLRGLTKRGVTFDLLSYELPTATPADIDALRESLRADGIRWLPLQRARDPRLRTKLIESSRGVLEALNVALTRKPAIVHGRSYIPSAIGDLVASTLPKTKLVFDCRGLLADENVDAGYWTTDRFEYKLVKRYEKRLFKRADGVVVLTEALRRIIDERRWIEPNAITEVIPCCVDLERFKFDPRAREKTRRELAFEDRLVVVYSGSLGGWYKEAEMASFLGQLRQRSSRKIGVLVLTHQDPSGFRALLANEGFAGDDFVFRKAAPREMAGFLSAGDLALSFIMSCFSKLGSSPTKVAEYLACGLPVVLNGDVGDQKDLGVETDACVVVDSLSADRITAAVPQALELAGRPLETRLHTSREVAERRFGLDVGITRYERLYERLLSNQEGKID